MNSYKNVLYIIVNSDVQAGTKTLCFFQQDPLFAFLAYTL